MASKHQKFVIDRGLAGQTPMLECIFCGKVWGVLYGKGGRFRRGAYICPNDCTKDYNEALEAYNNLKFQKNPVTGKFIPVRTASSTTPGNIVPTVDIETGK